MIRSAARHRPDPSDPQSWMRNVDPQIMVEHYGPAGAPPRHDATPVSLASRPGRTLQSIGMLAWMRAIAICMTAVILVTIPTGFGLLPGRAPLVPLLALMSVFSAMAVAGARNGRGAFEPSLGARASLRMVEGFGWAGMIGGIAMIALVVHGVVDVR